MEPVIIAKLLDKAAIKELKEVFINYDLPNGKVEICRYLSERVNPQEIYNFINEYSGNWHQHIYIFQKSISSISITDVINKSLGFVYDNSFEKLGTFTENNIQGINFIQQNTTQVIKNLNGQTVIVDELFAHVIKIWVYQNFIVISISTFDSNFAKWTDGTDEIYRTIQKINYDSIILNFINKFNDNSLIINPDIVPYQSAAKKLFIDNKYQINRGTVLNSDGGQQDISIPNSKFYFSQTNNLGYTARILNETFTEMDRTHKIIYSYWIFDNEEYKISLRPQAGLINIINGLLFKYKMNVANLIIENI